MKCEYCGKDMDGGLSIGTGTGSAHAQCWHLRNPFIPKLTFDAVIWNFDDQGLMRDLLQKHVPQDVKDTLFILGSIIFRRCNVVAHGEYSTGDMVKMTLFCSFLWPVAIYKSKLRINFK